MHSSFPNKVTAVVLAGGGPDDPLAQAAGVSAKALVPVAGRPLAAHVLTALRDSDAVARTILVGPESPAFEGLSDVTIQGGRLFSDSVALGLGAALALGGHSRILLCTADLPWLTGAAIDRFVAAGGADLNYPVIPAEAAMAAFPEQKRTFVKLRQGRFTGGNLALLNARIVPDVLLLADRFFRARKNPLALSALFGIETVLALLRGRADITRLEERLSALLGASVQAVITPDASLGADLDRPDQLTGALASASGK